jgi:hypothetical protein
MYAASPSAFQPVTAAPRWKTGARAQAGVVMTNLDPRAS